jgi:hypothetical protein
LEASALTKTYQFYQNQPSQCFSGYQGATSIYGIYFLSILMQISLVEIKIELDEISGSHCDEYE